MAVRDSIPSLDLKSILREKILVHMVKEAKGDSSEYFVMVVDDCTAKIVNSCVKLHDLVEAGVTVLIPIKLDGREKIPFQAIYFLQNSDESVKRLIVDFKSGKKSLYRSAHLFFTAPLSEYQESLITACDALMDRVACLKYLNCEFVGKESRFFTFGREINTANLYEFGDPVDFNKGPTPYQLEVKSSAHQLATLCLSLNELPNIRYYGKSKVSQDIAAAVMVELESMKIAFEDSISWNANRGVLLIVDRAIDPVAPLMHEYTYQAAVYDMMDFDGDVISPKYNILTESDGKGSEKKSLPVVIDEYDTLWQKYRHEHIGIVGQGVTDELNTFLTQNKEIVALEAGGVSSDNEATRFAQLKAMAKIGSSLQAFDAAKKHYTKHVNISSFILDKFTKKYINGRLRDISELEQDMATGVDNNGDKTKKNRIGEKLVEFIKDISVPVELKLRLIMIYIISQDGIEAQTRKTLFKEAAISAEQARAVENLFHLGVTLQSSSKKGKSSKRPGQLEAAAKRAKEVPLELMRFLPLLQDVMSDLITGKLGINSDEFPYMTPAPPRVPTYQTRVTSNSKASSAAVTVSARSARPNRPGGKEEKKEEINVAVDHGPKFIVYVAGGATFSEVRSVYDISKDTGCHLVIGSNKIVTSSSFIQELSYQKKGDLSESKMDN